MLTCIRRESWWDRKSAAQRRAGAEQVCSHSSIPRTRYPSHVTSAHTSKATLYSPFKHAKGHILISCLQSKRARKAVIAIHSKQSRLYRHTAVGRIEKEKQTGKRRFQSKIMEPESCSVCRVPAWRASEPQLNPNNLSERQARLYMMVVSTLGGENRKILESLWPTNLV